MKKTLKLASVAVLLVVFAFSCKTQKTATTNTNNSNPPNSNQSSAEYEAPPSGQRNDPISEKKALEEATFVDGCIYKLIDNKRAALGEFQECLNMNPENDAANYEVAGLYHALGQSDRGLKYAAEAVRLDPSNIWYKFRYAEILQAVHRDDEAITIYKDMIAADPTNIDFRYRLADSQRKAERFDDALATYSEIEKMDGNSDTLGKCRIHVYEQKKDDAGIERTMNGLVASFPSNEAYYYDLAGFYESHEQQDKANELYRKMAAKFPFSATPHLKLAEVYKSKGQETEAFKEAVAGFTIPEQLDNKIAYLGKWYPIGDTAAVLSPAKKKEADSLCRVLRRTHKDDPKSFTVSGDYLMKDNRMKEARVQYRKAIEMSKEFYMPWKQLLKINAETKDDVQQEKDCKEVLELFPTQPHAYFYLGSIQFRKKKYAEALLNLQTATDYNFDEPAMDREIRLMMIECYRSLGDHASADKIVEKMIKMEPNNLSLQADLATSLVNQGKEFYRAEQMMLKVVEKEPTNADYLATLAWIEFNMADYKLADEWMRKALAIAPNNAKMNERMGDIQFRLKNTDEAVKYWNKAKSLGGGNPDLDEKIKNRALKDDY
ncbi:MAG TPA: tetratricopeptide repeat protein [Bacteroidia bacterium]|nr:tetratricopeptide repeat protein [Bacteroidia bacterium]